MKSLRWEPRRFLLSPNLFWGNLRSLVLFSAILRKGLRIARWSLRRKGMFRDSIWKNYLIEVAKYDFNVHLTHHFKKGRVTLKKYFAISLVSELVISIMLILSWYKSLTYHFSYFASNSAYKRSLLIPL